MRKGITLLETLIVLTLSAFILPFLFRMISTTFIVVREELDSRNKLKKDLAFVLEKERVLTSISASENIKYFVKKGEAGVEMVILGEDK